MIEIAGLVLSSIGLAADLAGRIVDWVDWEQADLLVDRDLLPLAMAKDILDGAEDDYHWSSEDKVATRELKGTHSVVMAADEKKRQKYRVVRGKEGDRLVLMKRLAG